MANSLALSTVKGEIPAGWLEKLAMLDFVRRNG
jgi:hypothetical protein